MKKTRKISVKNKKKNAICDESRVNMDGKFEKSAFEKWSGAQNFAFNVILKFLKLQDIVKILTIVHRSGLNFVPSPALLNEIVQKALLSSSSGIPFCSTAMIISENKTLTLQKISKLYDFIKESVTSEFEEDIGIIVTDNTLEKYQSCTFVNAEEEEDGAEGLRFKVIFASSQCSDEECNKIVLWHCSICKNPNSECSEHVTTCEYCDGKMCGDCLLDEDMCKDCGFVCIECGDVLVEGDDSNKIICEGSICGGSGPYCLDCADFHNDLEISTCTGCNIMACGECRPHIYYNQCERICCSNCRPIGNICHQCNYMACSLCDLGEYCKQCKKICCDGCNSVELSSYNSKWIWICKDCKRC